MPVRGMTGQTYMFENLTEKLDGIFRKLKSRGRLDEENIKDSLKEIRLALLEADVNFRVVKEFVEDVRSRAVGQEVLESLTPGQQVVKIVHEIGRASCRERVSECV